MNTTVIEVRTSPHMHAPRSVDMIMRNVVYALLPLCAYSVWLFGISALALLVVTQTGARMKPRLHMHPWRRHSCLPRRDSSRRLNSCGGSRS